MMIPWEREIYLTLLQQYMKEEQQRREAEKAKRR